MQATITIKVEVDSHGEALSLAGAALTLVHAQGDDGATATVKTVSQGNPLTGQPTLISVQSAFGGEPDAPETV